MPTPMPTANGATTPAANPVIPGKAATARRPTHRSRRTSRQPGTRSCGRSDRPRQQAGSTATTPNPGRRGHSGHHRSNEYAGGTPPDLRQRHGAAGDRGRRHRRQFASRRRTGRRVSRKTKTDSDRRRTTAATPRPRPATATATATAKTAIPAAASAADAAPVIQQRNADRCQPRRTLRHWRRAVAATAPVAPKPSAGKAPAATARQPAQRRQIQPIRPPPHAPAGAQHRPAAATGHRQASRLRMPPRRGDRRCRHRTTSARQPSPPMSIRRPPATTHALDRCTRHQHCRRPARSSRSSMRQRPPRPGGPHDRHGGDRRRRCR